MKLYTDRKVRFVKPENMKFEMEQFASIDGRNTIQVGHFQQWANKNKAAKLKVNGKWNRETRMAYSKFGRQWENLWKSMYPNYQITSPEGKTRAGYFWDSVKQTWISAKDAGILSNVANVASQYGVNLPQSAVAQMQPGDPSLLTPPGEAPVEEPTSEGGSGTFKWVLIIGVLVVGGYFVVSKMSKGASGN